MEVFHCRQDFHVVPKVHTHNSNNPLFDSQFLFSPIYVSRAPSGVSCTAISHLLPKIRLYREPRRNAPSKVAPV
jgi:hypothetical protein